MCIRDSLWGKHHPGLPQTGVRRAAAAAGHCRRPGPRPEGAGTDLQGGPGALLCKVRLCERGRFRLHPRGRGVVPDAAEVLRGTIWNGLRLAPAVFSGRIIFKRAMPERPRKLRHCIFTGGGVKVDGICSAAFCESAALRQTFRLNCKVTGFARGSPFEERLPPLRGSLSP